MFRTCDWLKQDVIPEWEGEGDADDIWRGADVCFP